MKNLPIKVSFILILLMCFLFTICPTSVMADVNIHMVKDILPGYESSPPEELTNVDGTLFFIGHSGGKGRELWRSDGTESGTVMVKDINPGPFDSNISKLTNVNETLFFMADDGVNGAELWKSDGTEAGTIMVKDINPGDLSSQPDYLTNVNGTLYFKAYDNFYHSLWKSDGTEAGTKVVKNLNPSELVNVSGTLFFMVQYGVSGDQLWKSDGTETGTSMVKEILPGASGSSSCDLTSVNGTLFFKANGDANGWELWKSDGTEMGTSMVKDILSGASGSSPELLTNVNGALFFTADDGVNGRELWKSDGTETGTVMVKDIWPGGDSSIIGSLIDVNGLLFFSAQDGVSGNELWKSDGTATGTLMVKDINLGLSGSGPSDLAVVNGMLFFAATDNDTGRELWKSDGTEDGTMLVKDIWPGEEDTPLGTGPRSSSPYHLTSMNGTLLFVAQNDSFGDELWKSDGTEKGTVLVKDFGVGGVSDSNVYNITNVEGTIFFSANDRINGEELWKSNGTEARTVMVKDINPGWSNTYVDQLTNINGKLFFRANDGIHGYELWKSDGTEVGTVMVKDINPGIADSSLYLLNSFNGILFFRADDGVNGWELWKSDGTEAGTIMIKDINPGDSSSGPDNLINFNGMQFFSATDGVNGAELWKSDGTEAGTIMVKDIRSGVSSSSPGGFTIVNETLFFRANDGVNGAELWKSDGTEAGTLMVKDCNPVYFDNGPHELTNVNGTLFFTADDGVNGRGLWKSDGTEVGTVMLKNISPGGYGISAYSLTNVNGTLFFTANESGYGRELWKSDGTEAGTVIVKDILPAHLDSAFSVPTDLTNVNGTLFFNADDGVHGRELWKSHGSEYNTAMIKDISPGAYGSSPTSLTNANGTLFFTADDGVNGRELWKFDIVSPRVNTLKVQGGRNQTSRDIQLFAASDTDVEEYRVWERGTTEPETWTALPAQNVDGLYPIAFTLNGEMKRSKLYVRFRGVTGVGTSKGITVKLPAPTVSRLSVEGGNKQTTLSLTLLALIKGDIGGDPTHYRVWDENQAEPTTWTALPPLNPDGYYPIPFTLSSLDTKVNVYLKAKGDLAASNAKKTRVRLMEPKIKQLEPREMPLGSTQPVVVTGGYFGPGGGFSEITFGGVAATVVSWADEEIQCTLPLTVPTGNKVDVVVTSQEGLVGKAKSYTVWPFWAGTWVGRADQTAFSPNPVGPLGYEWRIYWIEPGKDDTAVVQMTDGKRLTSAAPVTIAMGGSFAATGFQKDSTKTTVTFTFPVVNQMEIDYFSTGATGWTETGEENAVFMRPSAEVYYDRYYTGESTDQWSSVAGAAPFFDADNVHLFQFKHKKGKLQIKERSSGKAKFKGYAEGDVFAVHAKDSFLSGKVVATNAEDTVTEVDAVYRWENDVDLGWGEMDVRLSTGAAGVPDGISTWTLTLTENDASDTRTPAAEITVNASKNKITVEVSGTDYNGLPFTSSANGEIYDWPSGGGNFAVSTKNFSIWGRMEQNGTDQITGTFQQTDLWWAGDKEGTVGGVLSP